MQNEIKILLAGSLLLSACGTEAKAQAADTNTPEPTKASYDPTATIITPTIEPTNTMIAPTPTETLIPEIPLAESCILPVMGGDLDSGLRFLNVLTNRGDPIKDDKTGIVSHHLGWDIGSNFGEPIVNACDGVFIWSGRVPYGDQSLGNVVVMKYTYEEGGQLVNVYMRYAHMENIVTDLSEGSFVPMGQKIGEVGASGGGWHNPHLHIDLWTEKAWLATLWDETNHGNLGKMAGFYSEPEQKWDEGRIRRDLIDPRKWFLKRTGLN